MSGLAAQFQRLHHPASRPFENCPWLDSAWRRMAGLGWIVLAGLLPVPQDAGAAANAPSADPGQWAQVMQNIETSRCQEAYRGALQLAQTGDATALTLLGFCHQFGLGTDMDEEKAKRYWEQACQAGDPTAARCLIPFLEKSGPFTDIFTRWLALRKMAAQGQRSNFGWIVTNPEQWEENWPLAERINRDAALFDDDPVAQYNLSKILFNGLGVESNPLAGLVWLRKSAAQMHPAALYMIGTLHGAGIILDSSPQEATAALILAADRGDLTAQKEMGKRYSIGRGVEENPERSFSYWQMAAEQGDAEAMVEAGQRLSSGSGCPPSREAAARYLQKAAEKNYAWGMVHLASLLLVEKIDQRDLPRIRSLLQSAMDLGLAEAGWALAESLARGNLGDPQPGEIRQVLVRAKRLNPDFWPLSKASLEGMDDLQLTKELQDWQARNNRRREAIQYLQNSSLAKNLDLQSPNRPPLPEEIVNPEYKPGPGESGKIVILVSISETGEVENSTVAESNLPAANEACLQAIRLWKFSPGLRDGKPVSYRTRIPFSIVGPTESRDPPSGEKK